MVADTQNDCKWLRGVWARLSCLQMRWQYEESNGSLALQTVKVRPFTHLSASCLAQKIVRSSLANLMCSLFTSINKWIHIYIYQHHTEHSVDYIYRHIICICVYIYIYTRLHKFMYIMFFDYFCIHERRFSFSMWPKVGNGIEQKRLSFDQLRQLYAAKARLDSLFFTLESEYIISICSSWSKATGMIVFFQMLWWKYKIW